MNEKRRPRVRSLRKDADVQSLPQKSIRRLLSILIELLALASACAQRNSEEPAYFAVSYDTQRDVRILRSAIETCNACVIGVAPEGRLIVRATPEQIAAVRRMGEVTGADELRAKEAVRDEVVERELGARRPTREQWNLIAGEYAIAEPVAPNELALCARCWMAVPPPQ